MSRHHHMNRFVPMVFTDPQTAEQLKKDQEQLKKDQEKLKEDQEQFKKDQDKFKKEGCSMCIERVRMMNFVNHSEKRKLLNDYTKCPCSKKRCEACIEAASIVNILKEEKKYDLICPYLTIISQCACKKLN